MDTTVTETLRHSLTVSDSDFQLTLISGPTGAASTVAGPTGPAGTAGTAGAAGAAGPNVINSDTSSDGNADIEVNTLAIATSLTMSGDQSFLDSKKAIFGTGSDLQIYHDNSQSRIQAELNDLWIVSEQADASIKFFADSGTGATPVEYMRVDGLNEVTEFKKNIRFSDDKKIQLGASQDLEIYHDASNSYIDDKGAGNLNIRGANLNLQKYTGETFVACVADGSVSLYHDNASKLSTSATGIAVTGVVTATGNITTSAGDISVSGTGNLSLTAGNVSTASGNITTSNGNITTTIGNVAVGNGNVSVTNGDVTAPNILASADLGYSSGGAETQGTNFVTPVTLNVVVVSLQEGGGKLFASVAATAAGSCVLTVGNSSASPVTVAPIINFAVIKVATS